MKRQHQELQETVQEKENKDDNTLSVDNPPPKQRKLTDFHFKVATTTTNNAPCEEGGKVESDETKNSKSPNAPNSSNPSESEVEIQDMTNTVDPLSCNDGSPDIETLWKSRLGDAWFTALKPELTRDYFSKLCETVERERSTKTVYPPPELVFNAFQTTPLDSIKVVIVGQDPYHGPNQAMGLCFSVRREVKVPPSLVNMFKEIGTTSKHGDLSHWASQGVFMLNSLLTVVRASPMSHKCIGWETFTDKAIDIINTRADRVIFLLWGKPAQQKGKNVNRNKHLVLEAGHPSPLSIKHFAGCRHFEKCNEDLRLRGLQPIDWCLPQ